MLTSTPPLEEYWAALARVLPAFSPEQQRTAVTLYRELAKGAPLAREPLRAFVYADNGVTVGFGGLAAAPMHHTFRVKGQTIWTWCAWDSLFIPALLGERADVSSPDPDARLRARAQTRREAVRPRARTPGRSAGGRDR